MSRPTITLIRKGELYRSLDVQEIPRLGTDEVAARVTFANGGLIRRDLLDFSAARAALKQFEAADLLEMAQSRWRVFSQRHAPGRRGGDPAIAGGLRAVARRRPADCRTR